MKYSRSIFVILLINILIISVLSAQDIPERPVPPRLVNDFARMLSDWESDYLEQKLVAFNDSTSTQIAIVTINSIDGYDIMDYAQRLGEKWGIGQRQLNNGILILVKPNTPGTKGEITIVQGYGLEGAIPDITCAQIIDNEILPAFKEDSYFAGLDDATSTLMSLARGEFSSDEYTKKPKKSTGDGTVPGIIIFIVILIIMVLGGRSKGSNNRNIGSGNLPLWLLLGLLNSGGSHKGSWGGFSGGSSSGGGFGGFGGGSFGGGGARGSW
ncbi:MAG TPA: TPM domain-containing protein [Bacteroidales bacterium]|nr:TPM domain-containing protein [Bacteroidales bacterium]